MYPALIALGVFFEELPQKKETILSTLYHGAAKQKKR